MHPLYDVILADIRTDIRQMVEEGHDQQALLDELTKVQSSGSFDALVKLQEDLWRRPSPSTFAYDEPSDWQSISRHFPDGDSHRRFRGSDQELADRIHAGWLGRCAGCQLGKPLEGLSQPGKIKRVLQYVGSWPLRDYMNSVPEGLSEAELPESSFFNPWRNGLTRGRFSAVAPDDDIHYALISQETLQKYGVGFTTEQAIERIAYRTPGSTIFAAGRNMWRTSLFGLKPPFTAMFGNPCRQSLGAMIRCDPWGWGAPANPALAARMAWTDAVGSQTRNGIYSGIFFSVLMADTLASGSPAESIDVAAQYVPPDTRFAEMVRFVKKQCARHDDWGQVNAAIYAKYPSEVAQFNHSIPNAAIVLMGLLMGDGDFSTTLGITVSAGIDTDCTGATVGSIMGCALGTAGIPSHWTAPFNDTIRTDLSGLPQVRISAVAAQMYELARPNARKAHNG
jgi:ADP-ribosylglycohydrolase